MNLHRARLQLCAFSAGHVLAEGSGESGEAQKWRTPDSNSNCESDRAADGRPDSGAKIGLATGKRRRKIFLAVTGDAALTTAGKPRPSHDATMSPAFASHMAAPCERVCREDSCCLIRPSLRHQRVSGKRQCGAAHSSDEAKDYVGLNAGRCTSDNVTCGIGPTTAATLPERCLGEVLGLLRISTWLRAEHQTDNNQTQTES